MLNGAMPLLSVLSFSIVYFSSIKNEWKQNIHRERVIEWKTHTHKVEKKQLEFELKFKLKLNSLKLVYI